MDESIQYFDRFQTLFKELKDKAILRGNILLVEPIEEPEMKTESGLIIATVKNQVIGGISTDKAHLGIVVAVGQGYYDSKTGETIPIDIPVGSLVITPKYSPIPLATFPGMSAPTNNKLWLVDETEIRFYYKDWETYQAARKILN